MGGRLDGKVAIVTGAGSAGPGWGNGKATATLFAREGASVFAVDRNLEAAEQTQAIIAGEGGACETFVADVSHDDSVAAMAARCMDVFGRVDVLHNNVGVVELGGVLQTTPESWDRVIAVNQKSVFLTVRHVAPHMQAGGGGAIVNIASIAAIRWTGAPFISYAASKAAIVQMTRVMAVELAPAGIRCNVILPGLMRTPMVENSLTRGYGGDVEEMWRRRDAQCPLGHMGDAWDVARAALFLACDEARYITGADLLVDGGITAKIA